MFQVGDLVTVIIDCYTVGDPTSGKIPSLTVGNQHRVLRVSDSSARFIIVDNDSERTWWSARRFELARPRADVIATSFFS